MSNLIIEGAVAGTAMGGIIGSLAAKYRNRTDTKKARELQERSVTNAENRLAFDKQKWEAIQKEKAEKAKRDAEERARKEAEAKAKAEADKKKQEQKDQEIAIKQGGLELAKSKEENRSAEAQSKLEIEKGKLELAKGKEETRASETGTKLEQKDKEIALREAEAARKKEADAQRQKNREEDLAREDERNRVLDAQRDRATAVKEQSATIQSEKLAMAKDEQDSVIANRNATTRKKNAEAEALEMQNQIMRQRMQALQKAAGSMTAEQQIHQQQKGTVSAMNSAIRAKDPTPLMGDGLPNVVPGEELDRMVQED